MEYFKLFLKLTFSSQSTEFNWNPFKYWILRPVLSNIYHIVSDFVRVKTQKSSSFRSQAKSFVGRRWNSAH